MRGLTPPARLLLLAFVVILTATGLLLAGEFMVVSLWTSRTAIKQGPQGSGP
jgi:hypothetical protein